MVTDTFTEEKVDEKIDIDQDFPGLWKVIIHNDDRTSFDFVIMALQEIFDKTLDQAIQLSLKIHEEGNAIAGIYSYEIGEQKIQETTQLARENGFPLQLTMEQ